MFIKINNIPVNILDIAKISKVFHMNLSNINNKSIIYENSYDIHINGETLLNIKNDIRKNLDSIVLKRMENDKINKTVPWKIPDEYQHIDYYMFIIILKSGDYFVSKAYNNEKDATEKQEMLLKYINTLFFELKNFEL